MAATAMRGSTEGMAVVAAAVASQEREAELMAEIADWKRRRRAVILAHNYQVGAVQDVADFVGDSLGLSRQAAQTAADVIVFCGVHFMAETASILSPDKTVLLPDPDAGCSLADTIDAERLRRWKAEHPGAVVVSYVNTSAEVKAESDYCCTSGNALKVVQAIPPDREILFLPDFFLGSWIQRVTGRRMHIWMGECHVHAGIHPERIGAVRQAHPDAELLVHPECGCTTSVLYYMEDGAIPREGAQVVSTEGMIQRAHASAAREFLVATETGILHRMRRDNPDKQFIPVSEDAVCPYMKKITLAKVRDALRDMRVEVRVPREMALRARAPIERMLAIA
jgi:quinolinate synthase